MTFPEILERISRPKVVETDGTMSLMADEGSARDIRGWPDATKRSQILPQMRQTLFATGRLIKGALKLFRRLIEDRFPHWSHVRHQARWERKWARPDYNPFWRTEEPQKELVEAIQTGWLPHEGWIYDIGCGAGESSRWLSQMGLHTVGLDFSAAAIEICRRFGSDNDRSRFEVVDMCAEEIPLEPAAAMIDRGCFHQIPEHFRSAYVRNAARLINSGGHFLLIAATYQRDSHKSNRNACSEEDLCQEVEQLFPQYFKIERVEPTTIKASDGGTGMPAVAFWMSRHVALTAALIVGLLVRFEAFVGFAECVFDF
jgi:SAM-dependent methyltransferase